MAWATGLYHLRMATALDIAHVRYRNALALFDEFVRATVSHPDAATLRGLERRFAERLCIQPSYWSQIKSRARQIGERLARQFEVHCHKPPGWMDVPHGLVPVAVPAAAPQRPGPALEGARDDDERFIVDLVLSYYRRDPRHAKTRLLQLLGEALEAPADVPAAALPAAAPLAPVLPAAPVTRLRRSGAATASEPRDGAGDWAKVRLGVAPLKRKR
jgi:hypothetical protein